MCGFQNKTYYSLDAYAYDILLIHADAISVTSESNIIPRLSFF
jgi:hypothetical protein